MPVFINICINCIIVFVGVFSKVLEFIKDVDMPLTEEIYASLITAYGLSGYVMNHIKIVTLKLPYKGFR